jgi:DNA-directed RNA polymerase subunit beta
VHPEGLHLFGAAELGRKLVSWEKDLSPRQRSTHQQQEVYWRHPLMTDKGTFIFNGIERVVVSPGGRRACSSGGRDQGLSSKAHPGGAPGSSSNTTPRTTLGPPGSQKKFRPRSSCAHGFGTDEDILRLFHKIGRHPGRSWPRGQGRHRRTAAEDVTDPKSKKVLAPARKKITPKPPGLETPGHPGPPGQEGPPGAFP